MWAFHPGVPMPPELQGIDLNSAIEAVQKSTLLSAPAKLTLLAELVRLPRPEASVDSLVPFASSLVDTTMGTAESERVAEWLLKQLGSAVDGEDPLGRISVKNLGVRLTHDPESANYQVLSAAIQATVVVMGVKCVAYQISSSTGPAMRIYTVGTTSNLLSAYTNLVDPLQWPTCPVQSMLFKSMTLVDPHTLQPPGTKTPVPGPDTGWSATIAETVDLGFGAVPNLEFLTYLDFVFFNNQPNPPASTDAIGCTYDLHKGGGIDADRGYLLVDTYPMDATLRRIQTLKEVHFKSWPLDLILDNPLLICEIWGRASAIVGSACLTH
jgi:hypothetical protein